MIVVITHPRSGGVSYLADTLRSIDESATGLRVVVTDSAAPIGPLPASWTLDVFERPPTARPDNRWSLWRAFALACEAGEELIACEDDVSFCLSGARYAELLAVPHDVAWVSLFDIGSGPSMPHGLWVSRRSNGFTYAQAIKFPARTCALMRRLGCADYDRRGADNQLAAIGGMLGLSYAIHVPSLVQHVGVVSSVGNGELDGRTSQSWRADYNPQHEPTRTFV